MRLGFVLCLLLFQLTEIPAWADQIIGRASVIDGDTIEIHSKRIRLSGVDTPESGQLCYTNSGHPWRCGQLAAFMLADYIGTSQVSCQVEAQDKYGRYLSRCMAHGRDVGEWLVSNGWAVRYYDRAGTYRRAQGEASASGRGIWQGKFQMPKHWRRENSN